MRVGLLIDQSSTWNSTCCVILKKKKWSKKLETPLVSRRAGRRWFSAQLMELHSRAPCQKALCVLQVRMGSREPWTMYRNHILLKKSLNWKWLGAGKCGGIYSYICPSAFSISMVLHLPFHSELQNHKIISVERDLWDQSPSINPALPRPNKPKPQQYDTFFLKKTFLCVLFINSFTEWYAMQNNNYLYKK